MPRLYTLLITILISASSFAQHPGSIVANIDTIWPGGAPGTLNLLNSSVVPLASSRACAPPVQHYAAAVEYQNGKVVVLAHEGILANQSISQKENLSFILNAINWITPDSNSKAISLKQGWINTSNTGTLQSNLSSGGYSFGTINTLSTAALSNTDILILGNDWNSTTNYSQAQVDAIDSFVANGGGLLITGLGWSYPGGPANYPMNTVAQRFGIAFTTNIIFDNLSLHNGYPMLHNLWPDNLDTGYLYCPSEFFGENPSRGDTLRILRLAVSCNGEFTQSNGGIANTSTLIDNWLDQINIIYGREYCVRFELIPNNDQLIFDDAATDPWPTLPPGSGGCTNANLILSIQASVIDNIIGAANYDLSHVIAGAPFGGGCAGSFKSGLSGGLDIPVTRHEIGHQFGQAHTIANGGDNNYEPEVGNWTIQGGNGHGHGHAVSFHQLAKNLSGVNANVGQKIATGNTLPTVQAGPDQIIPHSTPFELTSTASDPDPGDSLTYVWDNLSPGPSQAIPISNDLKGALFWRLLPTINPNRYFPGYSSILADQNMNSQGQLPTQARVMDFRVTVNDNHKMLYQGAMIGASGSSSDDIRITVADAGPFKVTSQSSTGIVYSGGSSQLVEWTVNGTDTLPINTQVVEITLSADGGNTFPYILDGLAPNTGTAMVTLPNITTSAARIRVKAVGNIYFDINSRDFTILQNPTALSEEMDGIKIYPNPAKSEVFIESMNMNIREVNLLNLQGKKLETEFRNDKINLNGISSGIYLLKIQSGRGTYFEKIVIE